MSLHDEVESGALPAADDGTRRAILKGAAAAILGGAAWALIVGLTNTEVGWVAWGVGGLIGFQMARATDRRGTRMASIAAGLAVAGLLVGKLLILQYVTTPAFTAELRADSTGAAGAAAHALRADSAFPAALQARLDALPLGDTLPDALWSDMVAAGAEHLARLPADERDSYSTAYVDLVRSSIGLPQMFLWQFTAWDLLWFGLAVTTAWGMLRKPAEQAPAPADPAGTG